MSFTNSAESRPEVEEARCPEVDGDNQHAEQQEQGVHVDGGKGLVQREHAQDHHEHRAHQRPRGPVDMQARHLAQADEEVGDEEDDKSGDHEVHFSMNGHESSSLACYIRNPAGLSFP